MQPNQTSRSLALPIAIVIGFAIIAVAIFISGSGKDNTESAVVREATNTRPSANELATRLHEPIATVTANDHIRGNPNAPMMFVTYTNYECPACRNFYIAMNRILQEYGQNGLVAWTFRHLPLADNYPNSNKVANAAECVAELGGSMAFWDFSDQLFGERSSLEPTQISRLPHYATEAGIDEADFTSCVEEERHVTQIKSQSEDAFSSGAMAVPYTVVMAGEQVGTINGPQPYIHLREIVERTLAGADQ